MMDGSDSGFEELLSESEPVSMEKEVKEGIIPAQNIPFQPIKNTSEPTSGDLFYMNLLLGLIQVSQIFISGYFNNKIEKNRILEEENKDLKDKVERLEADKIEDLKREVEDLKSKRK
jgi:hypothetical protein